MPVIPEGYGQINYRFRGTAIPTGAEITMGFFNANDEQDLSVLAAAADAAIADLVAELTDSVGLLSVLIKLGPNEFGPSFELASTLEGASSGETVPPNVSVLIKKGTNFGGRTGRGRCYLPGIGESSVDDAGVILPTQVDELQAAALTWVTDLEAAGLSPRVLHGPNSPITIPHTITSVSVDSRVATQRRRLRR